jgi:hypothetical protein
MDEDEDEDDGSHVEDWAPDLAEVDPPLLLTPFILPSFMSPLMYGRGLTPPCLSGPL